MKALTIGEIVQAVRGRLLTGNTEAVVTGVHSDSREVGPQDMFCAVQGEHVDGHDFIPEVLERGCRTLLIFRQEKAPDRQMLAQAGLAADDVNVILVADVVDALQDLARYYLSLLHLKRKIAVTGSVGKTSTRDMLYAIASTKYRTAKNIRNFNNVLGLPMAILAFPEDAEVAVIEMGMMELGEIHRLVDIVRPDVAIITNIGVSHIMFIGSREGILQAKLEVTDFFGPDSVLIVNQSCDLLARQYVEGNYRLVTVGLDGKSDYIVSNVRDYGDEGIKFTLDRHHRQYEVELPIPGAHNALNATLAIAAGETIGVDLASAIEGLKHTELSARRLNIRGRNGIKVIDDTYNAGPESMRSAINTLLATKGLRKVAILGDMRELGDESERCHRELGAYVGERGVDLLVAVGPDCRYLVEEARAGLGDERILYFPTKEDLVPHLSEIVRAGDVVLVKASNATNLGDIPRMLLQ